MTSTEGEQLRHDRINLGRVLKRLEASIDTGVLNGSNLSSEGAWVVVQGVAQKLKYAKTLLSNIETSKSFDHQLSYLQVFRNTLYRLEEIVELANSQVKSPSCNDMDYLSLVSLPPPVENIVVNTEQLKASIDVVAPGDARPPDLFPGADTSPVVANREASLQSPILSSSLKTHEELSEELARMATQLRRNAEHFSAVLEKDSGLVMSAEEVLNKNAESLTRERERLKTHSSKSSGTTWFTIGAILVVCLATMWMFVIIRVT